MPAMKDLTILSITLRLQASDGTEFVAEVDPNATDAMFWSRDAVDKFLLPFYVATGQADYAADIRRSVMAEEHGKFIKPLTHKRLCLVAPLHLEEADPAPVYATELEELGIAA